MKNKVVSLVTLLLNSWWKIGLFFLIITACIGMLFFAIGYTGVSVNSKYIDVVPSKPNKGNMIK